MKSTKYLDAVKQAHQLKNDTALADLLGVGQNTVSQWRNGKRFMDNEMCLKLAQALDMQDPMPIIMAADMDRAERAGQRSLWEVFSPRMAHSGLVALLVALLLAAALLGATGVRVPKGASACLFVHVEFVRRIKYRLGGVDAAVLDEESVVLGRKPLPRHVSLG